MSEEKVATRLQHGVKMLHQFAAAFFGEVNKDVHAENDVHFPDVNTIGQVHLNKINHFAQALANLLAAFHGLKMSGVLPFADAGKAAAGVNSSVSRDERIPTDIGGKNFDIPGLGEGNGVRNADGD